MVDIKLEEISENNKLPREFNKKKNKRIRSAKTKRGG